MIPRALPGRCLLPVVALMGGGASACYEYVPQSAAPVPGQEVALLLTDRGRVALADRLGAELGQARGTLVRRSDSTLTLAVRETVALRGQRIAWAGEVVEVPVAAVGAVTPRTLHRGRSILLAAGLSAAVGGFIASRALTAGNSTVETDPSKPPTGPGPSTTRLPLGLSFGVTR